MARRLLVILLAVGGFALSASLLLPSTSGARTTATLTANVGPDFNISLKLNGTNVSHLDPGMYTIEVTDQSDVHNFHLTGPGGVDQGTGIAFEGTTTWTVTLVDGSYEFKCDAHPAIMVGNFSVGTPPPPPPPPPPATPGKLKGVVGPGFNISLKTKAGKAVRKVKAGKYTISISDRSASHNFHLLGPGLSRKTGVPAKGSFTWKVTFKKGKRYFFRCDAHPTTMKGSFKAV